MIQLQHIDLAFGGRQLLDGITWTIKPNRRIGLIGPNGAGKSTLLRVIAGVQPVDEGTIQRGGDTVGYLAQDVQELATERSVLAEAMEAFTEVIELQQEEHRLTQALGDHPDHTSEAYVSLLHALERVHAQLVTHEAHRIQDRTEAVLTGLGFDPEDLERPVGTFSGGWRMRVALARLLLQRPDVLLLDEPTNHLDIDSIGWLEAYLKGYSGTVIIVSHDRYFLDRMVTHTAELIAGHLTEYAGNYTFYLTEREERRTLQRAAYENQQKMIAETERFIERFRYKASKARQVQSRVKQLEKLERIPPPPTDQAAIAFRFPPPPRSGRVALELSVFSKTYEGEEGTVEVFDDAGPLHLERGDKVALIGKNGAGKSTLARMLHGTEPFDGERTLGYNVTQTFFAQHQADSLDPTQTVYEALASEAQGHTETEIRSLLGAFLFSGDDVLKPVSVLSGGEKSRVALARTLLMPANFLILDEPTNHLDIQSIQVLIEALRQYAGTFVIVSHDRHFLDQVVQKVWRVEDGGVREYFGSYSEYLWQAEHGTASRLPDAGSTNGQAAQTAEKKPEKRSGGPKTKEQKRAEAEARARRKKGEQAAEEATEYGRLNDHQLRHLYAAAEAAILEKETALADYETQLGDPDLYTDPDRARTVTDAYERLKADLKAEYQQWEQIAEVLTEREG